MAANYKSMIKSAFSNKIHKLLNPENKKTNEIIYNLKNLSEKEKLQKFDALVLEYQKSTIELRNAMNKRRDKNKVMKLREENGKPRVKVRKKSTRNIQKQA